MSQVAIFSQDEMADMKSGLCPPAPKNYVLPTSFPCLQEAARISYDIETYDPNIGSKGAGTYRGDGKIVGAAIAAWDRAGVLMHAEYYPVAHRGGPNCDEAKVYQYLSDQMSFFEGELIGTNLLYDMDWSGSKKIVAPFAKYRDIQWAEALLDELAFNYKLETLAQTYLGHGKVKDHFALLYGPDYIQRFHEVHPGHARMYGLGDVLLPKEILDKQYVELEKLGMMDLFKLESRLTPLLLYMKRQGVRIDMKRALEVKEILEAKRAEKLRAASKIAGVELTVENMGSPKLLAYIFDKQGIPVPKAAKGGISITGKWLHHLCGCKKKDKDGNLIDNQDCGHLGRLLESANKYDKAKETFVDGYMFDFAVDGRIHADFHPLRKADDDEESGTESGRFSCTHPNLQNIPTRDDEIGPWCRGMFIPEEGGEWWAIDYSQIEYRFLSHYALELKAIKGESEKAKHRRASIEAAQQVKRMYETDPNTDFHEAVKELTGLKRKDAKNFNFRLVYGGGKLGAAQVLGMTEMVEGKPKPTKEFEAIWETYHGKAPFIQDLLDENMDEAQDTGEIRTILNRRSQFEFYEPAGKRVMKGGSLPLAQAIEKWGFELQRADTHKASNRKFQGSAADLIKLAFALSWEAGVFTSTKDFTISLQVHDEGDGTKFPTKRGEECYAELNHIMETAMPLNVPVKAEGGVGKNWAEAKG